MLTQDRGPSGGRCALRNGLLASRVAARVPYQPSLFGHGAPSFDATSGRVTGFEAAEGEPSPTWLTPVTV